MSASSGRKAFTRRRFLSIAGGTAGAVAVGKAAASQVSGLLHPAASPAATAPAAPAAAVATVAPAPAAFPGPVVSHEGAAIPPAQAIHGKPTNLVEHDVPAADPPVKHLFAGLKPGTNVFGWKVVNIHSVQLGAIPVVMENKSGERFQVDVCARDTKAGAPCSVTDAGALSFFLANEGAGSTTTNESHGLGAIALAAAMTRGAQRSRAQLRRVPGMLTLRERHSAYPNGAYSVPV